jgi:hypothetical protein
MQADFEYSAPRRYSAIPEVLSGAHALKAVA